MSRRTDYEHAVDDIVYIPLDTRMGSLVPTTDTVKLSNGGVWLQAVYLYADMADSTGLAKKHSKVTAAKIVKAFLATITRVIKDNKGEIRSYDGDRVMAIFVGDDGATRAARTALEIKWVVDYIIEPSIALAIDSYDRNSWKLSHRTGIDMGEALVVRAGVRDTNDLVSIGDAPNIAAKLSEQRGARTFITDRVWDAMNAVYCFYDGKAVWSLAEPTDIGGGRIETVRHSSWGWVVN